MNQLLQKQIYISPRTFNSFGFHSVCPQNTSLSIIWIPMKCGEFLCFSKRKYILLRGSIKNFPNIKFSLFSPFCVIQYSIRRSFRSCEKTLACVHQKGCRTEQSYYLISMLFNQEKHRSVNKIT